ncbi:hypothetical protein BH10ACT10_BH10ACT10_02160 [soil metagenome]
MRQDQLLDRLVEVLRADRRVQAAWLSGSLARDEGDQFSDVDLVVAVDDAERDALLADWDDLAASVAPIVFSNRLDAGPTTVLNHVTDEWLRFDVAVLSPEGVVRTRTASSLRTLFDPTGLHERLRPAGETLQPSGPRIEGLVREFLRVLGLLPVVLGRDELVVGASGSGLLRTMVVQLMLEDTAVEDRGGALRLRGLLPDDRMAAVAALPPIEATRESVIAVHLACAELFLPLARQLAARTGVAWPDDMERALRAHLERQLGLDLAPSA